MSTSRAPLIVGIGGTPNPRSTTETALRSCLRTAQDHGAETIVIGGAQLADLPLLDPSAPDLDAAEALLDAVRRADGLILASPCYHATVSGLVKNGLDYVEFLNRDDRPYFSGRAVGVVVTSLGPAAIGSTATTLRTIVHSLRGWPTPQAAGLDTSTPLFDEDGMPIDERVAGQLERVATQVVDFALTRRSTTDRAG